MSFFTIQFGSFLVFAPVDSSFKNKKGYYLSIVAFRYNTKKYLVPPCSLVGAPAPAPVLLPHATKFFDIPAISFIE
jgi:hypothetical protein